MSQRAKELGGLLLAQLRTLTYDERVAIVASALDEVCTAELMGHEEGLSALRTRLHGIDTAKELRAFASEMERSGRVPGRPVRS